MPLQKESKKAKEEESKKMHGLCYSFFQIACHDKN